MKIAKVTCVGAGLIGHSWATLFAIKGFKVKMQDKNRNILEEAVRRIESNINFLTKNKLVSGQNIRATLKNISTTTNLPEAVEDADYVQESVYESYAAKKETFKRMDAVTAEHVILASSASALSMTEIQKAVRKPERCIIAHPWNPPHLIPLVELVPGKATSNRTVRTTYNLMTRLGKVPIIVRKEVLGYIGNRLQAAVLREALDLVDKGVASVEDVDRAVRSGPGLRWAIMGPYLIHHLGGGGIGRFFEVFGPSYERRWRTMETWASLPRSAVKKAVEGVKQIDMVRSRRMEEIAQWRDEKLVKLLKALR